MFVLTAEVFSKMTSGGLAYLAFPQQVPQQLRERKHKPNLRRIRFSVSRGQSPLLLKAKRTDQASRSRQSPVFIRYNIFGSYSTSRSSKTPSRCTPPWSPPSQPPKGWRTSCRLRSELRRLPIQLATNRAECSDQSSAKQQQRAGFRRSAAPVA